MPNMLIQLLKFDARALARPLKQLHPIEIIEKNFKGILDR